LRYIIACNGSAERIIFPDKTVSKLVPGGAGFFALTGIQLWTDEVMLCAGFGQDYEGQIGPWLDRNHIDRGGFNVRDERNPINTCEYISASEWRGYADYGNDHFDSLDCFPDQDHLRDFLPDAAGVYVFRADDPVFWGQIIPLRQEFNFKLMWEIKATIATPEKRASVEKLLESVDGFSINRPEAFSLFEVDNDEAAIRRLRGYNLPLVVYRVGAEGLYILAAGKSLFAESFKEYETVDVTGCGNSSTAAAFYAWREGEPIHKIAAMANVAAAHNLRFTGLMEFEPGMRELALKQADTLAQRLAKKK
jgi:sugar/nucleoside kinase (ribokinase family)